jgi:hypothetical protein
MPRASNPATLSGKARLDVVFVKLDLVISKQEWTAISQRPRARLLGESKQGKNDFARELQSAAMDLLRYLKGLRGSVKIMCKSPPNNRGLLVP